MNQVLPRSQLATAAAIAFSVVVLTGCGEPSAASGLAKVAPPPEVGVVTVTPEALALSSELPGRLEASRVAEVRARAAGIVLKREFREGSEVSAGAVLYRIDPAPQRAALASAEAALAKAEANLTQAKLKAERYQPLVETRAISRQDFDDAVAARAQATADVAAAKAARETALLNLGYTTVTAPIAGRIGRALVTEGALVGQGEPTPLATVQQIDPLYVNLTQSSAELLRLRQALSGEAAASKGKARKGAAAQATVTLVTEDGQVYPHAGKLLFTDLTVDESTGAVSLRAEVPNPERTLLPGMYVRARLQQAASSEAIAIPQQAVQRTAQGANVLLVEADGKVVVRPVEVGAASGDRWLIRKGLQAGERVIVDGLQKARPGALVSPVAWPGLAAPTSAAAAGTGNTPAAVAKSAAAGPAPQAVQTAQAKPAPAPAAAN